MPSCLILMLPTISRYPLAHNPDDAAGVVQEAFLRALRYGDSFSGQNPRAWLFTIVRNTFFSMRKGNIPTATAVPFEEDLHREGDAAEIADPESRLGRTPTPASPRRSKSCRSSIARSLFFANSKIYPIKRLRA